MRKTASALTLGALVSSACAHATAPPATAIRATAGVAPARERPAMVPCPWPANIGDTLRPDPSAPPAPAGVVEAPRRRIPDCAPPDWTAPASLRPYSSPTLPTDRPRPVVEDYLEYVVTAPPAAIVERFKLDTSFYRKHADANGYPVLASVRVPDAALAIVRDQINYLLAHRPDVRDTMIARGGRVVVMAEIEIRPAAHQSRPIHVDERVGDVQILRRQLEKERLVGETESLVQVVHVCVAGIPATPGEIGQPVEPDDNGL